MVFRASDAALPFVTRNAELLEMLAPQFEQDLKQHTRGEDEPGVCRSAGGDCEGEAGDAGADCTGVAAGTEAVDRADSGDDEAASAGENNGAVSLELTADNLKKIDEAAGKIPVEGNRYLEHLEKMTGR